MEMDEILDIHCNTIQTKVADHPSYLSKWTNFNIKQLQILSKIVNI